jgi:hypothetical protein
VHARKLESICTATAGTGLACGRYRPGLRPVPAWPPARAGSLGAVQLTTFWERMRAQFGDAYAESVAKDHVLTVLGGRTVDQALADGEDVKVIWRAVCETFSIPERRH